MSGFLVPPAPAGSAPGARPTFSVLVGAYQAARTAPAAVASALEQTAPPREVIVCDDGSTDDLEGALAPWADQITLLRKENGGGASALNAALAVATGDFVAVLDADDAYAPSRLKRLGELGAARPDLDVLATDAWLERDGRKLQRFTDSNPFPVEDQRRTVLQRSIHPHPAIRRERLARAGGWDESLRIAYDWDCSVRMIVFGAAVGLVDEPLLHYRLADGTLSANRAASLGERARWQAGLAARLPLTQSERALTTAAARASALRAIGAGRNERARGELLALAGARDLPAPIRARALLASVTARP